MVKALERVLRIGGVLKNFGKWRNSTLLEKEGKKKKTGLKKKHINTGGCFGKEMLSETQGPKQRKPGGGGGFVWGEVLGKGNAGGG